MMARVKPLFCALLLMALVIADPDTTKPKIESVQSRQAQHYPYNRYASGPSQRFLGGFGDSMQNFFSRLIPGGGGYGGGNPFSFLNFLNPFGGNNYNRPTYGGRPYGAYPPYGQGHHGSHKPYPPYAPPPYIPHKPHQPYIPHKPHQPYIPPHGYQHPYTHPHPPYGKPAPYNPLYPQYGNHQPYNPLYQQYSPYHHPQHGAGHPVKPATTYTTHPPHPPPVYGLPKPPPVYRPHKSPQIPGPPALPIYDAPSEYVRPLAEYKPPIYEKPKPIPYYEKPRPIIPVVAHDDNGIDDYMTNLRPFKTKSSHHSKPSSFVKETLNFNDAVYDRLKENPPTHGIKRPSHYDTSHESKEKWVWGR